MTGLVEFLTARLDEDQAAAERAATQFHPYLEDGDFEVSWRWCVVTRHTSGGRGSDFTKVEAPSAARVLADIAAKRAVIEIADGYEAGWPATDNDADWDMEQILQALAVPYSDHRDYRRDWKSRDCAGS